MSFHCLIAGGLMLLLNTVCSIAVADDVAAIRQSADAFSAAFNRGDAKAVAALWTEGGRLVDEAGRTYSGRPAVEAAYAGFFQEHPGAKIKVAPDSIRLLSTDAAIEEGSAALEPGATGTAKYMAVHVKQNGQWLMADVREWNVSSPAAAELLQDLDWLVGTWAGEEQGAKTEVVCRWLPSKSFLERQYKVATADGTTTSGVQVIGLNPRAGQIVSWGFVSDGSHSVGAWVPRAGGWAIDAAGLLPNGVETHAVNVLTRLDDNAYAWQSIGRSVGGQPRPDTDEIILKRSDAKQP